MRWTIVRILVITRTSLTHCYGCCLILYPEFVANLDLVWMEIQIRVKDTLNGVFTKSELLRTFPERLRRFEVSGLLNSGYIFNRPSSFGSTRVRGSRGVFGIHAKNSPHIPKFSQPGQYASFVLCTSGGKLRLKSYLSFLK